MCTPEANLLVDFGVLRPTHMETGPRFIVSSERLEKPGIELTTPGLQGQ